MMCLDLSSRINIKSDCLKCLSPIALGLITPLVHYLRVIVCHCLQSPQAPHFAASQRTSSPDCKLETGEVYTCYPVWIMSLCLSLDISMTTVIRTRDSSARISWWRSGNPTWRVSTATMGTASSTCSLSASENNHHCEGLNIF